LPRCTATHSAVSKSSSQRFTRKVCRFCEKGIQPSPIDAGFSSVDDSPLVESNLEPRRNSEPVRPTFANGASTNKLHGAPRPIGPHIAAHGFGVTSTSPTLRRDVWRDIRRGASAGSMARNRDRRKSAIRGKPENVCSFRCLPGFEPNADVCKYPAWTTAYVSQESFSSSGREFC
jgi:hypothetical protein